MYVNILQTDTTEITEKKGNFCRFYTVVYIKKEQMV